MLLGDDLHYGLFSTGHETLAEATSALTDVMITEAAVRPGMRVLDIGCGSGNPACRLAEEQQADVLGITTSAIGVEASRDRARVRGLDSGRARGRVTIERRDGTATGLADESFDRVWVMESSHLMPDRAALIRECARVLRPQGRLVLCDLIRRREIPFLELREKRHDFSILRSAFGAARLDSLEEYARLAEAAGLVVDVSSDLTAPTRLTFARWKLNLERNRAAVTSILGAPSVEQFEKSLSILDGFWADETLGYGLLAATRAS